MAITRRNNAPWTRKHDMPGVPLLPSVSTILFPKSLEELITLCRPRGSHGRLRAAGSHWALSKAAISDQTFVETHDPNNAVRAMGRTLFDIVPKRLSRGLMNWLKSRHPRPYDASRADVNEGAYLVHVETGKRVYQLYSELDLGDDGNARSLAEQLRREGNPDYLGPWAFQTLGGAGGQTVFGALTTGTHGGDIQMPPIADSVVALHLVADGGKHYWIEPEFTTLENPVADEEAIRAFYGSPRFGGRDNFDVIRDDKVFNSVVVGAGRFGIVYSVVLRAVRQYSLHEERRLTTWQSIKSEISNTSSSLYSRRFLQVAICLTPFENFSKNLCGVTKRWNVPMAAAPGSGTPSGRDERRGRVLEAFNSRIQGPLFEKAGNSHPYNPDPARPNQALPASFLERACSNSSFVEGVIDEVMNEIQQFIDDNSVEIGGAIAAVAVIGGAAGLALLIPALIVLLAILAAFLALLRGTVGPRLGSTLNDLKDQLLNRADPAERAAGLFIWHCIAFKIFSSQQADHDYEAISYAVMDAHDYFDRSCNVNVDSIEVFFDATDPMLITFVDALLAFETRQEFLGRAFVGYVSLRFTGPSRALLAMQRFPVTCAVEVAGLKDVTGTTELIDFAISLSRNRNFAGILHWGQRNESTMADIQFRFGDSPANPVGNLQTWRDALSRLTDNGRLTAFSSEFTRTTGLEIVVPKITSFSSRATAVALGDRITLDWDCSNNPPITGVRLDILRPNGTRSLVAPLSLAGSESLMAQHAGTYRFRLTATITRNGESRRKTRLVAVVVT